MITVANYPAKSTNIDFAKLGTEYKQGDEFVKENIDLYNEDESIKKFIDVYITKLNKEEGETKEAPAKKPAAKKAAAPKKRAKKAVPKKAVVPKAKKPVERAQGEVALMDEKLKTNTGKKGLVKALVEKEGEAKRKATGKQFAPRDRMRAEQEIRGILKTETAGKDELTTAEVVMVGRKINAQRSLYSQFMDLGADHQQRRWPTAKNLKIWAANPGQSDLLGVDNKKKDDTTVGVNKGKSLNFWMM